MVFSCTCGVLTGLLLATRMLVDALPLNRHFLDPPASSLLRKTRFDVPPEAQREDALKFLLDLAGGGDGCGLKLSALASFSVAPGALRQGSPLHRTGLPTDFCGVPERVTASEKYASISEAMRYIRNAEEADEGVKKEFEEIKKQISLLQHAAQTGGDDRLLCTSGNDRLIQQRLVDFLKSQQRKSAARLDATVPRGAVAVAQGGFPLQQALWKALPDLQAAFKANNYLVYVENVFPTELHERLLKERARLWKGGASLIEPSCSLDGKDRMGGFVRPSAGTDSKNCATSLEQLYEATYGNPELQHFVSRVTGRDVFPSDLPLELRRYGEESSGMAWHSDIVMYEDALLDYEIVYTLDNHGKSRTDFIDGSGELQRQLSKPNSIFIVQAAAARHMVSPSEGGRRDIVKGIYTGTMKKSSMFWEWGTNDCDANHPNRVAPWTQGM